MKSVYSVMFFVSIALVVLAVAATVGFGLRFGVDFKGGSVMEISFKKQRPPLAEVNQAIAQTAGVTNPSFSPIGDRGVVIRLGEISESTHQEILQAIRNKFGEIQEDRFDSVGPTVGRELKSKSLTAIVVLLLVIVSYVALVFRKLSRVLSSWAMGVAAVVALIHDVVIPIGVFALLGYYQGVEISAVFVAAALTILGYSVSDTVVVFDRVRENVLRYGASQNFGSLTHKSILQTLTRSLNTTFTTLLSLLAVYFFGGQSIKFFALALIIGIFLGAYSSIFVASPILVWWSQKRIGR